MRKNICDIFSDVEIVRHTPDLILKAQIPDKIFKDVKGWIKPCRNIKDSEYGELLNHRNIGTGHNSYQISIPRKFIDNSLFLGYLIHFGQLYLKKTSIPVKNIDRSIHLKNYPGHFDGYDIWMNFTSKGDDNPEHDHTGTLSGIIYIKDKDKHPTKFPTIGYTHIPNEGEILLFPSHLRHSVGVKTTTSERITASFNLVCFM